MGIKPGKRLRWILPLVFTAAALCTLLLFAGYTRMEYFDLALTPTFQDLRGWELYALEGGEKRPLTPEELSRSHGTVYLARTLDPAWEETGYTYLKLDGVAWQTAVYLDGELVYSVVPGISQTPEEAEFPVEYLGLSVGGESVNVTLPPGWGGKALTVAARQGEGFGQMPSVYLTSAGVEQTAAITAANRLGMPAAAYAALALVLLGLFLYGGWQKRWDWPLLALTLAAFGQVLYWLREYDMSFVPHWSLNIPLAAYFPQLFVLLPQIYLTARMTGKRRRLCAVIVGLCGLVALIAARWPGADWLMAALYLGTLAVLTFGALEVKAGSRAFRLFFQGLALLLGTCLLCVAVSAFRGGPLAQNTASLFALAWDGSHYDLLRRIGQGLFLLSALLGVMETIWRAAESRAQVELLSVRNDLAQENLRILQESGAALAKTRHEMMGHLNALQALAGQKDYARVEEYLAEVTRQTRAIPPMKLTDHPVVNAILLQYAQRAKQAGTRFECKAELPEVLPIPDSDLSSFLTNLLSNALRAAQGEGGWIEVTIHIRGRYLFMECRNSYSGELDPDNETGLYRSHRGAGHGWGMKIMEDVARRYQSELQVEGKDGAFLARTALLMPEK